MWRPVSRLSGRFRATPIGWRRSMQTGLLPQPARSSCELKASKAHQSWASVNGVERFSRRPNDDVPTITTLRVEKTEWEDENGNGVIDAGEFVIETSINYFAQTRTARSATSART